MWKTILIVLLDISLLTVSTAFDPHPAGLTDASRRQTEVFNVEGKEGAWRQMIAVQPTAQPIPTSSSDSQLPESPNRTAPPLGLTLALLGICCVMLLFIGVIALGIIVRNQNRTAGKNE